MNRSSAALAALFAILGASVAALDTTAQDKPSKGVKVRLLGTKADLDDDNCFLSSDGSLAVIGEGEPGKSIRWGLWNLSEGKLVRFLSAEKGKGTAPYAGDDNADFGAKVDFDGGVQSISVSTDNKLAVGLSRPVLVWELATGKLLHELENRGHHPHTFRFVDDRHIAAKFQRGTGVERIDAVTSERKTLLEPTNYESYGGGVHGDDFTLVSVREIYSLSLKTGQQTSRAAIPPGSSRYAPSASWYTRDGSKFLIQRQGRVEVWDTATWTRQGDTSYLEDNKSFDLKAIARSASLLAIGQPGTVELWDAVSGGMRTLVVLPTERSQLCALSDDASRMVLSRDRAGAVVVEFDGVPETGAIDVAGVIDDLKPQPTR